MGKRELQLTILALKKQFLDKKWPFHCIFCAKNGAFLDFFGVDLFCLGLITIKCIHFVVYHPHHRVEGGLQLTTQAQTRPLLAKQKPFLAFLEQKVVVF